MATMEKMTTEEALAMAAKMANLDKDQLKDQLEYSRELAVMKPPEHITDPAKQLKLNKESLMAVYHISNQLKDTWDRSETHFLCDKPEAQNLKIRFVRSMFWQCQEFLLSPFKRLRAVFTPMMDEQFKDVPVLKSSGSKITTYEDIFEELQGMMEDLVDTVWSYAKKENINVQGDTIPTSTPREILLELALWNTQDCPTHQTIRELRDPRTELKLDYMRIDVRYNKNRDDPKDAKIDFKNLGEPTPSGGVPAMHHVAVDPSQNRWLIGSTGAQFNCLEGKGALTLVHTIRDAELNGNYKEFLKNVFNWLKDRETYHLKPGDKVEARRQARKLVFPEYRDSAFFNHLDRSDHMGISLSHNLQIKPNCWRCKTLFNFQENLHGQPEGGDVEQERHKFTFKGRGPHNCAEMISNLRIMIEKRSQEASQNL